MRNSIAFKVFAIRHCYASSHGELAVGKLFYWFSITTLEGDRMKIIPVMDILNGVVVHAVRGRRNEYQPLKSVLCAPANPLDVALAFKALGFRELYVADLDAITGKRANFSILRQIADETGLELMVDAGIADLENAEEVLKSRVSKVIIGTETLPSMSFVGTAVKSLGKERVVVSLDLKGEKVISGVELGKFRNPLSLLREFKRMGVDQIIVLDLARVGSGEGVNLPFLKEVLRTFKGKVFVGGGVRDTKDLLELRRMSVFGVLIATALHSGRIPLEELKRAALLP
jgi:phosphoribosylformimino-5-aminoimidazole carboxamide ribotide isomerase